MKGYALSNTKDIRTGGYMKPPFKPGQMMEMPRASAMGMYGNSVKLPVNALYGVEGYGTGEKVTSMSRKTSKSAGGSGYSSLTTMRLKYGVEGSGDMNYGMQCYGISGVEGGGGQGGKRSSLRSAGGTR